MSLTASVLSFAALAALVTVVPGLDTALVLRTALRQGGKHAFATALGINTGALVWGAGAAVGVSALLTASTIGYAVVRVAGAAYLVWLGARLLAQAARPGPEGAPSPSYLVRHQSAWHCWRRGLLTNLLNPKVGAFYVAVLPQFIPAQAPHLLVGLLLALVHDVEGMLWFSVLILAARSVSGRLSRRSAQRCVDGVTGVALVGFGLRLALQPPPA